MRSPKPWIGYAVAIAATAVVSLARAVYDGRFGTEPAFLVPFLVPVVVAGRVGGLRCGLFATAFAALTALYFFTEPIYSFKITNISDVVRLGTFVAVGVCVTFLNHQIDCHRQQAEGHARESLARQTALEKEVVERREAERLLLGHREQLEGDERRLRLLLESLPQLVWTCNADGQCDYLSRQWVEYTGVPEAEQLGNGWAAAILPDDLPRLLARWQKSVNDRAGYDAEYRIRAASGEYRWFKARSIWIANADGTGKWFGTCTDIHDAKESAVRLKEGTVALEATVAERTREIEDQRRLLDAVLDALPAAVIIADPTGRLTRMNRACEQVWGVAPMSAGISDYGEWVGYWPDTGRRIEPHEWAMSRALLRGEACPAELVEFERFGDRSRRVIMNAGAPVFGANGDVVAGVVASIDVTDRIAAERASRDSGRRFQAIFHAQFQFIGLMSPEGVLLESNRTALAAAGVREEDVLGRPFWETAWWTHDPVQQDRLRQAVRQAAAGLADQFEASHPRPDGTLVWVDFSLTPHVEDGRVVLLIPEGRDITERKVAEAAVRESERQFKAIFNSMFQFIGLMTPDGVLVEANDTALRAGGLSRQEVLGKPFWEAGWWSLSDATRVRLRAAIQQASGGELVRYEVDVRGADGQPITIDFSIKPCLDESGSVVLLIPEGRDITERKRAEAAMEASETRFQAVAEACPSGLLMVDGRGRIVFANRMLSEMFGWPAGELDGQPVERLVPNRFRGGHEAHYMGFLASPRTRQMGGDREVRGVRKDGTEFPVEIGLNPLAVGSETFVLASVIDITPRKPAEALLRASEEKFRLAFEHAPIGVSLTALDGRWLQVNHTLCDLTGYTEDELLASDFQAITHPDDLGKDLDRLEQFLAGTVQSYETEKRYVHKLGHVIHVYLSVAMVRDDGKPLHFVCYIMDISARKQSEAAIRASEERFRSSFDNAPIGMALVAPDGRWLRVNRSLCRIVGYAEAELLVTDFQTITHPDDLDSDLTLVQQVLAGAISTYQMEKRYFHKAGHVVHILLAVSLVRDEQGDPLHFISQIEDVTAAKQAEAALRLSEEQFRLSFDRAPIGKTLATPKGKWLRVNQAACEMLGYTEAELLSTSFRGVTHPDDIEHSREQLRHLIDGTVSEFEAEK